ncbi:hypothetical protein BN2476_240159 [Paraburkholderia piptadeniae]|uniref:Uncharacterized protein n=1 Tax=Paraburkholderia piptadeniae TaxID=1701573 RepID=A0A1N7RZE7_9BURK|nr:hypothetical protein BN2476_240159 [Paraburkholderia piptadeniae]
MGVAPACSSSGWRACWPRGLTKKSVTSSPRNPLSKSFCAASSAAGKVMKRPATMSDMAPPIAFKGQNESPAGHRDERRRVITFDYKKRRKVRGRKPFGANGWMRRSGGRKGAKRPTR